jgi:small-conductance mechanosensitive channel
MPLKHYLTVQFWQKFWEDAIQLAAGRGLKICVILLLYWSAQQAIYRVIDATLARMVARHQGLVEGGEDRANRLRTLQGLVKSLVGYILFFVLVVMLLQAMTVDVTGLITTAGIGGIAIGFGAQKLVKDVISGFFIIVEDQFAVGEYVTIGAATGVVLEIGMRITRLRDDQGRLWIISNGDISIVTNQSRAPIEAFVEVWVAPATDLKKAGTIVNAVGEELAKTEGSKLLSAPRYLGVSGAEAVRTILRVAVIADPRAMVSEQFRVREAILERFQAEGIAVA